MSTVAKRLVGSKCHLVRRQGLGPGDIVLDGDPAPPRKVAQQPSPHFSAHFALAPLLNLITSGLQLLLPIVTTLMPRSPSLLLRRHSRRVVVIIPSCSLELILEHRCRSSSKNRPIFTSLSPSRHASLLSVRHTHDVTDVDEPPCVIGDVTRQARGPRRRTLPRDCTLHSRTVIIRPITGETSDLPVPPILPTTD